MNKLFQLVLVLGLAGMMLAACSQPVVTPLTGADQDAVLSYTEAKTDNLLAGFNASDYAVFSRDFDDTMKGALTQSAFIQTRQTVTGKIGKYVSRQLATVEQVDAFIRVTYTAKFEQEDGVTVQVVFNNDSAHLVSGLWYTSPKLRGQ
ncbi:MAG: DUF3887 domain-containing protein [Anaerolineae bacterium]